MKFSFSVVADSSSRHNANYNLVPCPVCLNLEPAFSTVQTVAKIVKLCGSFLTIREDRVSIIH